MNVLFYIEPWVSNRFPFLQECWLVMDLLPLCDAMSGVAGSAEKYFLVGDNIRDVAQLHLEEYRRIGYGVLSQKELRSLFPNGYRASMAWYDDTASIAQKQGMARLVQSKLNGFVPDVIICPFSPVPFLRELFPQALILNTDMAPFSRAPFPAATCFDPYGLQKNGFLGEFSQGILQTSLKDEEKVFLESMRRLFLDERLKAFNPFTREELMGGKDFKHLLLLPLNNAGAFSFNGNCKYDDQWDLLCHVLETVPHDIGVVVTEHLDFEQVLTETAQDYLRRTHPHFIHLPSFAQYKTCSQFLLQHVDAVASVASSLCYQALLWRKPVCALGQCHTNAIADVQDIAGLADFLERGVYEDKDPLLHYILTRYSVPVHRDYLLNAEWLGGRLCQWLDAFRSEGVDKDFFEPFASPEDLLAYYQKEASGQALLRDFEDLRKNGREFG